jgi:hypothetical protein
MGFVTAARWIMSISPPSRGVLVEVPLNPPFAYKGPYSRGTPQGGPVRVLEGPLDPQISINPALRERGPSWLTRTQYTYNSNKFVFTKDFTEINHTKKHRNLMSLDYLLTTHEHKMKKTLVRELTEHYLDTADPNEFLGGLFYDVRHISLDVQEQYNREVVLVRNASLLTFAKNQFSGYIADLKKYRRYIHVHRENEGSFVVLETRYSDGYQRKVKRRMGSLNYEYRRGSCVLVTLTLDPSFYGSDRVRMWTEIKNDINTFLTKLRQYFKSRGLPMPKYVLTVESHKKGNPHAHIVFLGVARLMDWRLLRKMWGLGFVGINRDMDGKKIRSPVAYITKYITKTYTETNEKNFLTQSLSWLFNLRSYSCSRDLIAPLHPRGAGDWVADYVAICSPQGSPVDDFNLILDRVNGGCVGNVPPPITDHVLNVRG